MPSQKSNSWLCSSQTTNIQMFYPLNATKVRSGVCQPLYTGMTHTISGLIRMHLTLNNFYSTDSLCGLGNFSVIKNQPTSGQLFKKQCLKTLRLGSCHPGLLLVSPAGSVENPLFVHIYCKMNPSCPGYTLCVLPGVCQGADNPGAWLSNIGAGAQCRRGGSICLQSSISSKALPDKLSSNQPGIQFKESVSNTEKCKRVTSVFLTGF